MQAPFNISGKCSGIMSLNVASFPFSILSFILSVIIVITNVFIGLDWLLFLLVSCSWFFLHSICVRVCVFCFCFFFPLLYFWLGNQFIFGIFFSFFFLLRPGLNWIYTERIFICFCQSLGNTRLGLLSLKGSLDLTKGINLGYEPVKGFLSHSPFPGDVSCSGFIWSSLLGFTTCQ